MDISNNEILEMVRRNLTPEQIKRSIIYWDKRVRLGGEQIKAGLQTITMPFKGTVIFVDLSPRANWAHPCLYVLVECKTLAYKTIEASFPPKIEEPSDTFIVLLRYGQKPPHEHYFNVFD